MRIDSVAITGFQGIDVPDGTSIGSEFALTLRVRVFGIRQEQVDTASFTNWDQILEGPIHFDLIAIAQEDTPQRPTLKPVESQ